MNIYRKSRLILYSRILLILAALIPSLFARPVMAHLSAAVLQTPVMLTATQTATDEATQNTIEKLIAQLGDGRNSIRESAVNALVKIGQPAVQPLIKAMEIQNNYIRPSAADALGQIGDPQAVGPLIKALEDKQSHIKNAVIRSLVKIGQPAIQSLIEALGDENVSVRISAVDALGQIGGPQAVEALIKALGDEAISVQRSVAMILGQIGDPQAVQPLIETLEDKDGDAGVRQRAARSLGQIGDQRAVQPLIKALEDKQYSVRHSAANSLGMIKNPQAAQALRRRALSSKVKEVVSFVAMLLLSLGLVFLLFSGLKRVVKSQPHRIAGIKNFIRKVLIGVIPTRPISIYLLIVGGLSLSGVLLLLPEYDIDKGIDTIFEFYIYALAIGLGSVLTLSLGSGSVSWVSALVGCFVYFGIGFLPLLGALHYKKNIIRTIFILIQALLVILHFAVHHFLFMFLAAVH